MATISVIIPLYNGLEYIEDAIRSVFAQDRPADEIIVVDDGSTDGGSEVVRKLAQEHPIKLLTKENGGQGSARNFGVAASKGTLIALLDQDDVWYPNHLAMLEQPFLQQKDKSLGWTYSDVDRINDKGEMVCPSMLTALGLNEHPKQNLIRCLAEDMFVLPGASLISREAFDAVGGFDARLTGYEDDDLFLRLFCAGYHNEFISEALLKWRIHSASTTYTVKMSESRALYFENLVERFSDDPHLGRFFIRDLVAPRFSACFFADLLNALQAHNYVAASMARSHLMRVEQFRSLWRRRLSKMIVRLLYSSSVAAIARRSPDPVLRIGLRMLRRLA